MEHRVSSRCSPGTRRHGTLHTRLLSRISLSTTNLTQALGSLIHTCHTDSSSHHSLSKIRHASYFSPLVRDRYSPQCQIYQGSLILQVPPFHSHWEILKVNAPGQQLSNHIEGETLDIQKLKDICRIRRHHIALLPTCNKLGGLA